MGEIVSSFFYEKLRRNQPVYYVLDRDGIRCLVTDFERYLDTHYRAPYSQGAYRVLYNRNGASFQAPPTVAPFAGASGPFCGKRDQYRFTITSPPRGERRGLPQPWSLAALAEKPCPYLPRRTAIS